MTAELAEERARHRWIPVTERLPVPCRYYLVVEQDDNVSLGWRDLDGLWSSEAGETMHITHWRSLPLPPAPDQHQPATPEPVERTCEWKPDDDGVYWTACHESFMFIDGSPTTNNMNFCPYCGAQLVVVERTEEVTP